MKKKIDKKTKQFIADKFAKKWVEDNKEMLKDYQELCHDLLMFRAVWGIEIGFIFKNPEERTGCGGSICGNPLCGFSCPTPLTKMKTTIKLWKKLGEWLFGPFDEEWYEDMAELGFKKKDE